jgi:hypothetical protein
MKAFLGFLLFVALAAAAIALFAPASAKALAERAEHYFDPVPPVPPLPKPPRNGPPPVPLSPTSPVAEWRRRDREAQRSYEAGSFEAAAESWAAAAAAAPSSDVFRLRAAKDRALVFALLAAGAAPQPGIDPAAAEVEYRRRLEALRDPSAGAWLDLADYAASRGLVHHLAFVFERAFEKRHQPGEEVSRKVTRVLKERKEAVAELPPAVFEAVISELPSSEAAEVAREQAGEGSGIEGSSLRPARPALRGQDPVKLAEARDCMAKGDAEYRLAVPGSKEVNVHRRKALDLYTRARALYEEVDRESGVSSHEEEIHDLNRNIAELRKDLPIGK